MIQKVVCLVQLFATVCYRYVVCYRLLPVCEQLHRGNERRTLAENVCGLDRHMFLGTSLD